MQENKISALVKISSQSGILIDGSEGSQSILDLRQKKSDCIFDNLIDAACLASLSYVYSKLHPTTTPDCPLHMKTKALMEIHREDIFEVYDCDESPQIGAVVIAVEEEVIITLHGINFNHKLDHLNSLEFELEPSSLIPGSFHNGFLTLAESITPKIISKCIEIDKLFHLKKIRIVGHSRGAAIAQLLTLYLHHSFPTIKTQTILFGSPKVMCPKTAKLYNKNPQNNTIRVENPLDLAIYIPADFMGYGVVGSLITLHSSHSDVFINHSIDCYIESLETIKRNLKDQGLSSVTLDDYLKTVRGQSGIQIWDITEKFINTSSLSDFLNLFAHGLIKGAHSIVRSLPFR